MSNLYCTSDNPFSSEAPEQFWNQHYVRIQSKWDAAKQSQYPKTAARRNNIPISPLFQPVHGGYWLSSLRLRSELAQLVMRLQSWTLASRDAEHCSWVVAQRSLVRIASSASSNTGWRAVLCGQTGGRVGARAGAEGVVEGGGAAGGSRRALPPAAAPSQCSGLGWGTDTLDWLLLGAPFTSTWDGAGDWAASCLSLTWDNAACAFRAEMK